MTNLTLHQVHYQQKYHFKEHWYYRKPLRDPIFLRCLIMPVMLNGIILFTTEMANEGQTSSCCSRFQLVFINVPSENNDLIIMMSPISKFTGQKAPNNLQSPRLWVESCPRNIETELLAGFPDHLEFPPVELPYRSLCKFRGHLRKFEDPGWRRS